jgi:hypothetical protein
MLTGCNRAAAALLTLLLCSCASAGVRFDGQWSYQQSCGWNHTANLDLAGSGASYTGSWDDGTRVGGDSGKLKGEVRDDKLYLQFCSDAGAPACPSYGEASAYLVRDQAKVVWYRKSGSDYRPYLTLHRAQAGQKVPADDQCADDEVKDDEGRGDEPKDN